MSDSAANKIRQLISEINENCEQVQSKFWKFNRTRFLEIDDLGGHTALGYQYDKDFLKAEFPGFSVSWINDQRVCGRIEQILGIEVGSYSINLLNPLRQFRIRKPAPSTNGNKGTCGSVRDFKAEAKLKEAWIIACNLSAPNQPEREHIEQAIKQMALEGKAKIRNCLSTKKREKKQLAKKSQMEIKEELAHYRNRCEKLETENIRLKQELQSLKLQLRRIA